MSKKVKSILIICLVVLVVAASIFLYLKLNKKEEKKQTEEVKEVDVIQTKEFDYVLYDNKGDLYQEYFKKLKDILLAETIDDLEYAKTISALFVIDFYSLDEKKTNKDVGGLDFILEDLKENFTLKANDTMYKYIESNVYGQRKQSLPKVKTVEIKTIEPKIVKSDIINDEKGYSSTVSITYDKELGYPKEVNLTLVHKDNKIYILEVK